MLYRWRYFSIVVFFGLLAPPFGFAQSQDAKRQAVQLFLQAEVRTAERKYDAAVRLFERGLRINPNSALAHFDVAKLYEARANPATALYHYRWVILNAPRSEDAAAAKTAGSALYGLPKRQSGLPSCPGPHNATTWTDCVGEITFNSVQYMGVFKGGQPNGVGIMFVPNGSIYVGEFVDGKRSGHFTAAFANGDTYVGGFRNDIFNGQGTYTFENGTKYVGEYRDNKPNGQGTYTYVDGRTERGIWKDDVLVTRQ